MLAAVAAGTRSFEEFRAALLEPGPDGSCRGNLFTPDSVSRLLADADFVKIEIARRVRPGDVCPLVEISAERSAAAASVT